jgi:hypothetical protein
MPKKTSAEVKAMNDNQFATYKRELEGEEYETLENNSAFDAAILAFDISHAQPLSDEDRVTRDAIFTTYGRSAPVEGKPK